MTDSNLQRRIAPDAGLVSGTEAHSRLFMRHPREHVVGRDKDSSRRSVWGCGSDHETCANGALAVSERLFHPDSSLYEVDDGAHRSPVRPRGLDNDVASLLRGNDQGGAQPRFIMSLTRAQKTPGGCKALS
jgi:hypothetical protein